MELVQFADLLTKGGAGAAVLGLLYIIMAGLKRKWVYGWQYEEALKRIELLESKVLEWQQIAIEGLEVTDRSVNNLSEVSSRLSNPRRKLLVRRISNQSLHTERD